jgi:hypothetical protein
MGKYKRKTERCLFFNEKIMTEIIEKIKNGESKRSIAKSYGIHEATLRKRLKAGTVPSSLGRFNKVFSPEMEQALADHCRQLDNYFYGVTKKELGRFAFEMAEKNGLNHRFNKTTQQASKTWVEDFARRQKLSLRQPEKTSLARASGFNKVQVERFFTNLKNLITTYEFVGRHIYNMDETGLQTVPNKLPKIYAQQGKKIVGKIVSAERGQTMTAVCCMSASGTFVPPALIFPRKRKKTELMQGAPEDSLLLVSDSGYMNSGLFFEWLQHFIKMVKATKEAPVLLILDNHSSHLSLASIELARESGVVLLSLAPHTSHRLQSLDTGFFGPLKKAYAAACDNWQVTHPGRAITQFQVAQIFGAAYSRVASIEKAKNAFESCGIWPFNDKIFNEIDFAPAEVTNLPDPSNLPSMSVHELNSDDINKKNDSIGPAIESLATGSGETAKFCVQPNEIRPIPKSVIQRKMQNRKRMKSEVLTSSPYKNQLEDKKKEEENKERIKAEKLRKKSMKSAIKPVTKANVTLKSSNGQADQIVIRCPLCMEVFVEPPEVDWIQCSRCEAWWHDECTDYVGFGVFNCDLCK